MVTREQHIQNAEVRANQGLIIVGQNEHNVLIMNVDNKRIHEVLIDEQNIIYECSCEHFIYRGPLVCKHISHLQNNYGMKYDEFLTQQTI